MTRKNINEHAGTRAWTEEYKKYLGMYADDEYQEYSKDVAYDLEKFNDPLIVGAMIHRLVQERVKTNYLFEQILKELKEINNAIKKGASLPVTSEKELVLSEVDERIVEFVKSRGKATANEVQKALGYKGRNAASARLNHLYEMKVLVKTRAGRKVYYSIGGR